MPDRAVEDQLREEYFDLLPEIRRVAEHLEVEIRYRLLPFSHELESFEQIVVQSRIKHCESAIMSLRRRRHHGQEGAVFDPDQAYTLTELRDLAGVRVLAFPSIRRLQIVDSLRALDLFKDWYADPVLLDGETLAYKYWGYCLAASTQVSASTRSFQC